MPVVRVWCIPQALRAEQFARVLDEWREKIVDSVLSIPELGLEERHEVTVIFPAEFSSHIETSTIVIEITGLDVKPARTLQVRNKLAESVGRAVQSFYPRMFFECFITSFGPKQGFWCSDKEHPT